MLLMNEKMKSTPERIMDVAQTLILREGFHGVSVDSIIEETGVSKGTFFYHFKSKNALAVQLLRRFVEHQGSHIRALHERARAECEDPLSELLYFVKAFPGCFAEATRGSNGCLLNAFAYQLAQEIPEINDICQSALKGWNTYFTQLIEPALAQAKVAPEKAPELAKMMFCLMEGAVITNRIFSGDELATQFGLFSEYLQLLCEKAEASSR